MSTYGPQQKPYILPQLDGLSSIESYLLSTAEPAMFNCLIKQKFSTTNIRVVKQLNDCIALLDGWLSNLGSSKVVLSGDDFDSKFFARGIDLLLSCDHHFIVARTLVILYNHSALFKGKAREDIYEKILLDKHFYHLFLNWDDNIRCLFYQLILFKLVECRKKNVLIYESYLSSLNEGKENSIIKKQKPNFPKEETPTEHDIEVLRRVDTYISSIIAWKRAHPKDKQVQQKKTFIIEEPSGFFNDKKGETSLLSSGSPTMISSIVAGVTENEDDNSVMREIPQTRCVYINKALKEYKKHLMRYEEWEFKNILEKPKLVIINYRN